MAQNNSTNLSEAYQKIKELMAEEKWSDAHRACLEILHFDPENIKIIHIKNKIEKIVKKINKKAVKDDIKKLHPLFAQHKYREYLLNLKQLEPYLPDYPPLEKIILRATKKYEEELHGEQEITYQSENKRIAGLLKESKYQEAVLSAEKLRVMGIREEELKKLLADARAQWINNEIENNKTLLGGKKFEDMLLFYQRLLKIDPDSERVKNLIEQTKKVYQAYRIDEKKEFIYKSLEQIRTLHQLKKYEKASEACAEVLEVDPKNQSALNFQMQSQKKAQNLIDDEVITQMLNNQKKLKQEYISDPKSFDRF